MSWRICCRAQVKSLLLLLLFHTNPTWKICCRSKNFILISYKYPGSKYKYDMRTGCNCNWSVKLNFERFVRSPLWHFLTSFLRAKLLLMNQNLLVGNAYLISTFLGICWDHRKRVFLFRELNYESREEKFKIKSPTPWGLSQADGIHIHFALRSRPTRRPNFELLTNFELLIWALDQ